MGRGKDTKTEAGAGLECSFSNQEYEVRRER